MEITKWKRMVLMMLRREILSSPEFEEWAMCCVLRSYEEGDIDDVVLSLLESNESALKDEVEPTAGPDFKCCDGCRESFPVDNLTVTPGDDCLLLCSVCLHEYELST